MAALATLVTWTILRLGVPLLMLLLFFWLVNRARHAH